MLVGVLLLQLCYLFFGVSGIRVVEHGAAGGGSNPYGHLRRACVTGHNLLKKSNTELGECKKLCDQRHECKAFEYGVDYNGKGDAREGDCRLQSRSDPTGCNGTYENYDLYIKSSSIKTWEHRQVTGGCVHGSNIEMIHDSSVAECALRCDASNKCKAFEFGRDHGGSGYGRPNDCQLQDGTNSSGCNGFKYNFDLYLRTGQSADIPKFDVDGYWKAVTTLVGAYERETSIGSARTDDRELSAEFTIGMTSSVDSGFASAETQMSMSMSQSMSTSITTEEHFEDEWEFEANGENHVLWQWMFDYSKSNNLAATTKSMEFALTPSKARPPACLPGYFKVDGEESGQGWGGQECEDPAHKINYR